MQVTEFKVLGSRIWKVLVGSGVALFLLSWSLSLLVAPVSAADSIATSARLSNPARAVNTTTLVINEVDVDTPGVDTAEFIELFDGGQGNVALDGLVLVLFNGADDASYGTAFDLDGYQTNAEGFFLLGSAGLTVTPDLVVTDTSWLQNGADAVALFSADETDFPNNTPVTTTNLVDALVYDTDDADDVELLILLNPAQAQINEDSLNDKDTQSNQRCPTGAGGQRNTDTYVQATPTPGQANNCLADVVVNLTAPTQALRGRSFSYTLHYRNSGETATNVDLVLDLPAGLSYAADDSGFNCIACTPAATGQLIWSLDNLSTLAEGHFDVVVTVANTLEAGTILTTSALITTTDAEVRVDNNLGVRQTRIESLNLAVNKRVDSAQGTANLPFNGVVTYTIEVQNSGSVPALGVVISDVLPDGLAFGGYVQQGSGTLPISRTLVWGPYNLPAGFSDSLVFTATVIPDPNRFGAEIINIARFSSENAGFGTASARFRLAEPAARVYLPLVWR